MSVSSFVRKQVINATTAVALAANAIAVPAAVTTAVGVVASPSEAQAADQCSFVYNGKRIYRSRTLVAESKQLEPVLNDGEIFRFNSSRGPAVCLGGDNDRDRQGRMGHGTRNRICGTENGAKPPGYQPC